MWHCCYRLKQIEADLISLYWLPGFDGNLRAPTSERNCITPNKQVVLVGDIQDYILARQNPCCPEAADDFSRGGYEQHHSCRLKEGARPFINSSEFPFKVCGSMIR